MIQRKDVRSLQECLTPMTMPKPTTLLAIGWAAGDTDLLNALTNPQFSMHYVPAIRDAVRSLRSGLSTDAIVINGDAFDVYAVTAALRLYSSLPIVLLFDSVERLSPMQAVDAGADEWLLTTVSTLELAARIHARIRRYHLSLHDAAMLEQYNAFALNPRTHELLVGNRVIRLTPAETHILRCLAASPDRPVLASELTNSLGVVSYSEADSSYLLSVIQQLREKLDSVPANLLSVNDNAFLLRE